MILADRQAKAAAGDAGSSETRRYADAFRKLKQFLNSPRADKPNVHIVGPVRHAASYYRAFRDVHPDDSKPLQSVKSRLDVTGFLVIVDDQHIAHATRQHGSRKKEEMRGQRALEREDFARIPQIVGDLELIAPAVSGRRGTPAVMIMKAIDGTTYRLVLEARTARREIACVTMFKS